MNIIKSKDTIGHLRQRLLSLFLLSYLFAAHTSAQRTFEYKFSLEDFNIMAEMEAVSIETSKEGWAHTDRAATPIHTLRFLIPPGTEKEDFSVEYEKVLIRKEVSIGKAGWCENVEKALGLPEAPMSAITSPVTDRGIMHYREYRYRCLAVSPFVQDPETKDLNFIPRLAITFPEMEKAEGGTAHESLPDEIMDFRSTLANPDDFGDLYPLREANVVNEDPVDYLIITRDSLTDCFQNLMEWKNRKGLHTRVATLEEIYLQYPQSVIEGMTMDNPLRIIISGGGTGGHIFPAISIANAIKELEPTAEILFVGAEGRMEMQRVPDAGYKIVGLPICGFDRKHLLKNITGLPMRQNSEMLLAPARLITRSAAL